MINTQFIKERLLHKYKVNPGLKGFNLLTDAIEIKSNNQNIKLMDLYSEVAKQHNTTSSRVERSIRTCIETSNTSIFEYNRKITSSFFINYFIIIELEKC